MKIVWWKCSIGHSWRGRISDRTLEQKGCEICEEEYLSVLPRLLVMFYAKMKNLSVSTDYDKVIGIPLEMYIKEEKIAIETNEESEKMVALKEHLCSKREIKLMRVPYKIGMDELAYAGKIKKAFRSSYVFITSDEEEDVLFIRQRFFEWRRSQ